jgi:hypothetical protein
MRAFFALLAALALPFLGYSQNTGSQVVNLAGLESAIGAYLITSSIGEPAIQTFTNSNGALTQGFLQPEIMPCVDVEFRYYPNPAKAKATVEAFGCETRIESMQIIDLWGRFITTVPGNEKNELPLEGLSQGVYMVRVQISNGVTKTFNLVKISD